MSTTDLCNVREAATRLGVHENTVRNMEQRGQLKAVRLPGSGYRRFLKEDIERMRAEMFSAFPPPVDESAMSRPAKKKGKRRQLTQDEYL